MKSSGTIVLCAALRIVPEWLNMFINNIFHEIMEINFTTRTIFMNMCNPIHIENLDRNVKHFNIILFMLIHIHKHINSSVIQILQTCFGQIFMLP